MSDVSRHAVLQIARPTDVRKMLGRWIRQTRQRQEMTQPMLASASGVATSSLSRIEREGQGGLDNILRVLQALGELDGLESYLAERLRKAMLPLDLAALAKPASTRLRVRKRKAPE